MNQVPEEKKDSVTKTLAILGFVAIIILIVWLAVKIVAFIPSAFSSLASIADSIYNNDVKNELVISTKNSVVNSGETFTVSWTDMPGDGTYGFRYECANGVSVDIRRDGGVRSVECNTFVDLENDTTVDLLVNSNGQRFTDVEYQIAYSPTDAERITAGSVITVVNTSLPTGVTIQPESEVKEPTSQSGLATANGSSPLPSTGVYEPETAPQTPSEPTYVEHYIYEIPQSDPNGKVDLAVTQLGVGTLNSNDIFTPRSKLDADHDGTIQFEIKNIGTKTASSWSYEVALPEGYDYESGKQADLKPNERVVITLSFTNPNKGTETIEVTVDAKDDSKSSNDSKTLRVEID